MKLARTVLGLVAHSECPLASPRLVRRNDRLGSARMCSKCSKLRNPLVPTRKTRPRGNKGSQHVKSARRIRFASLCDSQSMQAS